ncbi:MAG TPA: hypothetical protein VLN72_02375, partial [Gillisia sp.]|nr:hypothetical protein [Gillisia sp.]
RNTNMLMWHKELWLIDHGAAFYFHHSWSNREKHAKSPFTLIKDHVLLPQATLLEEANAQCSAVLTHRFIRDIVELIPQEWLQWQDTQDSPQEIKQAYFEFLTTRLAHSEIFIKEAQNARQTLI